MTDDRLEEIRHTTDRQRAPLRQELLDHVDELRAKLARVERAAFVAGYREGTTETPDDLAKETALETFDAWLGAGRPTMLLVELESEKFVRAMEARRDPSEEGTG